jgi:HSP20 family molecular chaperone IbpA
VFIVSSKQNNNKNGDIKMYLTSKIINDIDDMLFSEFYRKSSNLKSTFEMKPTWFYTQHDDVHQIDVLLPGFKKEEINIQPEEHNLVISSNLKTSDDDTISYPKYVKKFSLSLPVSHKHFDLSKLEARFENGVLTLKFKKQTGDKLPFIQIL